MIAFINTFWATINTFINVFSVVKGVKLLIVLLS